MTILTPLSQIDLDKGHADIERLPVGIERAIQYAVSGLLTDGGHHKQWHLERILESLGVSLDELRGRLMPDYEWDDGIAP